MKIRWLNTDFAGFTAGWRYDRSDEPDSMKFEKDTRKKSNAEDASQRSWEKQRVNEFVCSFYLVFSLYYGSYGKSFPVSFIR